MLVGCASDQSLDSLSRLGADANPPYKIARYSAYFFCPAPRRFGGIMFCMSTILILRPSAMIMSPGFWSALQAPRCFVSIVMLVAPSAGMPGIAGPPLRVDVTFAV